MHPYNLPLQKQFSLHQNKERAAGASAYMRNQFDYFGIEAKMWRQIVKAHLTTNPAPTYSELPLIVKELWQLPQREYQYAAVEIIAAQKKLWQPNIIELVEYCIENKSWWDTVDHIASELTGHYFKLFPKQLKPITRRWNNSSGIWLQRSSIMFQKFYKKDTDTALLAGYILNLAASEEFFVQKAIGWALREYSKTNPEWVKKFVTDNKLSNLSRREALKRIER
jgi:3-methyladenine DNA glycosylase AlkD